MQTDLSCRFRVKNKCFCIEVRERNVTDAKYESFKIHLAYVLAKLTPFYKPVVMFEKECRGYEESASVLFEKLREHGYNKVFYILEEPNGMKNVVKRFSFKHYYMLFACETVIATEALGHGLERNCSIGLFMRKFVRGNKNYVFLQHGVMYMVSLNAEQRSFFNKSKGTGKQRVVVSSYAEAEHFIKYTNYEDEDMYVTGLCKFDRSYRYDDADRIVVMLTWRPWEINLPVEKTTYYAMLERIVESIPEEYKDKLIILPHPLLKGTEAPLWKNADFDTKYDEILRHASILITDYSSISYDAFYRGANIIFCWEELNQCMANYGPSAELMLKEDTAFGNVNYSSNVAEDIRELYCQPQSEKHLNNYRKIVEFHDNKNTERLIEKLKADNLIK